MAREHVQLLLLAIGAVLAVRPGSAAATGEPAPARAVPAAKAAPADRPAVPPVEPETAALHRALQVLVVTTPGWDAPRGTAQRFERSTLAKPFRRVGPPLPVWLGRSGLGWRSDAAAAPPLGKGEWILLVEDNPELRAAVGDSLEGQGYHVLKAPDAEAAMAAAGGAGHAIDLVLTDLVMPGINGVEMFTALRPLHPCAKLIVMTGHPLTEARMAVLDNIGSWIQKPFALNSLLRKVRLLLDAPRLPPCA